LLLHLTGCGHREGVEFSAFISGEGYHVIPISNEHQLQYACNVLNLGDSRIISVHAQSARQIVKDPRFNGDVQASGRCVQGHALPYDGGVCGAGRAREAASAVELEFP
jgi:hypothetical protein